MRINRVALWILAGIVMLACVLLLKSGPGYADQDREQVFADASARHPAGTDALGRDRLVRVSAALLVSLAGAVIASALSTAAAAAIGTIAAYGTSVVGGLMMLICEVFLALPWLFLLMLVRSGLPLTTSPSHSAAITFLVLAALGWPSCAVAVYKGVRTLLRSEWMLQARATGLRGTQVFRYMLPHLAPLLLPQFFISVPAFVIR